MGKLISAGRRHKAALLSVLLVALLLSLAAGKGWAAGYIADFDYTNGDFQSFNPARRLLDGQTPYVDFPVYLGTGFLYLMSGFMALFGRDFGTSLCASTFLSVMMFEVVVAAVAWLMLRHRNQALLASLTITAVLCLNPDVFQVLLPALNSAISAVALGPGNSVRGIRNAGICALVLAVALAFKVIGWLAGRLPALQQRQLLACKLAAAFLSGLFVLWSNDMGVAGYLCFSFVYFVMMLLLYKKDVKTIIISVLQYIGASSAGLLLGILVVTGGHPGAWFSATLGVAGTQYWYYLPYPNKPTSLLEADFSAGVVLVLAAGLFFLVRMVQRRDEKEVVLRWGLLAFLCLSCALSANMYRLVAGGLSSEFCYIMLLALAVGGAGLLLRRLAGALDNKRAGRAAVALVMALCCGVSFSALWPQGTRILLGGERNNARAYTYYPGIDGYLSAKMAAPLDLALEKIGDEKIFSTFASVLEVETGQFQPSGSDYIIHAMGDAQRQAYLESFRQGDFGYVVTISETQEWEAWIRDANWFLYRELYENYTPVFDNDYQVIWEPSGASNRENPALAVELVPVNEHCYDVEITAEDPTLCGTVDLNLSYHLEKRSFPLSIFTIHRNVYVQCVTEHTISAYPEKANFYLPESGEGTYIPVTMVDGVGKVRITGNPGQGVELILEQVALEGFFRTPLSTVRAAAAPDAEHLLVAAGARNEALLKPGVTLESADGERVEVLAVEAEGEEHLLVTVSPMAAPEGFLYPGLVKVG